MASEDPKFLPFKLRRKFDNVINSPEELLDNSSEKLWEEDPMNALKYERIERRKVMNWFARFFLSILIVGTFIFLIWMLFFSQVAQESRDLINIMLGAYVAVLAKTTDYWFKDKDDAEVKEHQELNGTS